MNSALTTNPKDALINDFAIRCFRDTADQDYIHARLAYRSCLVPQFLWSSLHCLEKYAKCILLLNRIEGLRIKHEVTAALKIIEDAGRMQINLSDQSRTFIERLESGARFRYFELSWSNQEHDIVRLDCAVLELRRYCQVIDYEIAIDGETRNLLSMELRRIEAADPSSKRAVRLFNGWLESVVDRHDHPARPALIWGNLYFSSSSRNRVKLPIFVGGQNAPLDLHPEILEDVKKYVHIPKAVSSAIENRREPL